MSNASDKRLIEVAFPLKQTSIDSVHEKNVRHGHISTLHIWPARATKPRQGDVLLSRNGFWKPSSSLHPACSFGDIPASPSFWLHDTAYVEGRWAQVPLE